MRIFHFDIVFALRNEYRKLRHRMSSADRYVLIIVLHWKSGNVEVVRAVTALPLQRGDRELSGM